jgi:hypothetical protein
MNFIIVIGGDSFPAIYCRKRRFSTHSTHPRKNISKFENLYKIKFGLLFLQVMSKFQPLST